MNNVDFPDFEHPGRSNRYWHYADNGTLSEFDWEQHDGDIEDWFKRCMEDFPSGEQMTHSPIQSLIYYQWLEKWFSQFIERAIKMDEEWKFRASDFCYRCEADDVPIVIWKANDPWYFTSLCEQCLNELADALSEFTTKDEEIEK